VHQKSGRFESEKFEDQYEIAMIDLISKTRAGASPMWLTNSGSCFTVSARSARELLSYAASVISERCECRPDNGESGLAIRPNAGLIVN
jgi:non-homologous end joining protein Ku